MWSSVQGVWPYSYWGDEQRAGCHGQQLGSVAVGSLVVGFGRCAVDLRRNRAPGLRAARGERRARLPTPPVPIPMGGKMGAPGVCPLWRSHLCIHGSLKPSCADLWVDVNPTFVGKRKVCGSNFWKDALIIT